PSYARQRKQAAAYLARPAGSRDAANAIRRFGSIEAALDAAYPVPTLRCAIRQLERISLVSSAIVHKWVRCVEPNTEVLDMVYGMEFREAVARAYEECSSSIEVAEQFNCSESWVRRLMQRYRETGSLEPRPQKLPDNNK